MKCKPVQWMCILVLIVIFAGCASTTKTNVDSQVVVQEPLQQFIDHQEILETLYQYTYNFDGKNRINLQNFLQKMLFGKYSLVVQKNHDFHLQIAVN